MRWRKSPILVLNSFGRGATNPTQFIFDYLPPAGGFIARFWPPLLKPDALSFQFNIRYQPVQMLSIYLTSLFQCAALPKLNSPYIIKANNVEGLDQRTYSWKKRSTSWKRAIGKND